MASEFYMKKINEAHELLDTGEYDAAINILSNLRTRIHEPKALEQITTHDEKVEHEYKTRYEIEAKQNGDPLERFRTAANYIEELDRWHCKEYLSFYDTLNKKYDL